MEETWLGLDEAPAKAPEEVGGVVGDPESAAGFETKFQFRAESRN